MRIIIETDDGVTTIDPAERASGDDADVDPFDRSSATDLGGPPTGLGGERRGSDRSEAPAGAEDVGSAPRELLDPGAGPTPED